MATLAATDLRPRRLVVEHLSITIEGRALEDVQLGGWVYGPELGTAPVVVIVGGITASPFPFGDGQADAEEPRAAWWPSLCAPDLIDPAKHTVLCPSWPGNGSTWKGFDDPGAIEAVSVAGLADLVAAWLDGCGCSTPVTWVGASLGGMVGVAFAARHAERCAKLISISGGLRPDGWGTATRHLQRELVRDGLRNGDVATGMSRARQLGMLTYRGRDELDTRFGKLAPGLDRPPVAEYLDHHGRRFAERFPVKTFLLLSEAIDRGWLADPHAMREAIQKVSAETLVIGVPGDMLFPWALQVELHRALQAAGADSSLWKLESVFGHDAFLADQDKLADVLRGARAFGGELRLAARPRFEGVGVEPVREIRIGLVGCGTVGHGLLEMIERQREAVADRYGVRFRVSRIAVRDLTKDRGPLAAGIPISDRALELVSDPEVDVVVEVAGGTAVEPILRAALAAGKPVVTANKALLASKLADLGVLAQRTETPLYCEAAAAAAIPIVRHLSHRADEVDSLWGIVNATCNFVMTRLEQGDLTLADAVAEAQRLGFAEAQPDADLDGHDAAAKLSILAYRAFGAWVRPDGFLVRGIRDIDPADCDLAESMGCRIRQIARAVRINGALDMAVEPLLLPTWHLLASVEEEYNAVYLRCVSSGDLSLFGKGAGALPTATAILGDLIDLAQDNSVRWPVPRAMPVARDGTAVSPAPRRHYLRVTGQPHPGLERKFEGLVRRHGLTVQNRATRSETDRVHMAFMISASSDAQIAEVTAAVEHLARVEQRLCLGVMD
ncbi:MAG: alpha/beta fold hydrolase [Acidobacteria bacterium]|nr:alpha/beta fold hydrolase [Acidobacteriota bacterium]MSO62029.1 alpha/beta fold hydrolase [Acidobacteriota bacterium]